MHSLHNVNIGLDVPGPDRCVHGPLPFSKLSVVGAKGTGGMFVLYGSLHHSIGTNALVSFIFGLNRIRVSVLRSRLTPGSEEAFGGTFEECLEQAGSDVPATVLSD